MDVAERAAGLESGAVLVDCLTLWLSNLILRNEPEERIAARLARLCDEAAGAPHDTVIVTNEVGLSLVPESALGRLFRDIAGRSHKQLAARAAEVYLAVMGMVLRLKPSPVETVVNPEYSREGS